jgi:hypothetical protein
MALDLDQVVHVPVSAKRRRRWPIFLTLGLGFALLILAIGGAIYIHRYAPLGSAAEADSGRFVDPHLTDVDGDVRAYAYHEGGIIMRAIWIENTGGFGVTVTGVETTPRDWVGLISVVGARFGLEHTPTVLAETQPLRSFSLGPKQTRLVDVLFRMAHCKDNEVGGSSEVDRVTVDFTVLGVHRSQELPLATSVWVTSPKNCPGRSG